MKILFACILLFVVSGCSKEVQWRREVYVLSYDSFQFKNNKYSIEMQNEMFGINTFVELLSQTKFGFRNTSSKGPYKIKFVLKDARLDKLLITKIGVFVEESGQEINQIINEKINHLSLIKNKELSLSYHVFDKLLDVKFHKNLNLIITVSVIIRNSSGKDKEYELVYKLIPSMQEGTTNIPLLTT